MNRYYSASLNNWKFFFYINEAFKAPFVAKTHLPCTSHFQTKMNNRKFNIENELSRD